MNYPTLNTQAVGGQTRSVPAGHSSFQLFLAGLAVCGLVGALLPAYVAAQECDLSSPGLCTRTSAAGIRSCRHEVREEYWDAVANCRNQSSARSACVADARDERGEAFFECADVCEARQEVCDGVGQGPYDPVIDPADFLSAAEIAAAPNPFFPLVPGLVRVYEEGDETITVTVTSETYEIQGVECITVRDLVEEDGEPIEDTLDWFAQDRDGNVWYFGEISQNFEDGVLVDVEGSWTAGVDNAKAGIVMPAVPVIGDVYRQEFLFGDAEDIGEILSLTGDESVPAADCEGACLVTIDTTPLEPDALENKYYKAGIGVILEVDLEEGARAELVEVIMP